MPNLIKTIPLTLKKIGISSLTIEKIRIPDSYSPENVIALIGELDTCLTPDERLAVMQEQGCCTTGRGPKAHAAFGEANKNKPLPEKIERINQADMPHKAPCRLNEDGTLSVWWGENGLDRRNCPCGILRKLPEDHPVPLTFCGCCGGHIRKNYQKSLNVKLKLKAIVSSSSNSRGKKRCEFLYEVIG